MKYKIYKYALNKDVEQTISLPKEAEILKVEMQNNKLCLWASFPIENENSSIKRAFQVVGTGWDFDKLLGMIYLDTVFDRGFVWHIFEEKV